MNVKRMLHLIAILTLTIGPTGLLASATPIHPHTPTLPYSHTPTPPHPHTPTADDPSPPASPVKLVFIHHSCGDNWLDTGNGNLGNQLGANNYYVSDTYYGWGPDGIGDNTDIGHWWTWFRGPSSSIYTQAVYTTTNQHASYTRPMADPGGENEIVMFKSCYPNSNLEGNPEETPPPIGSNPLRGQDHPRSDRLRQRTGIQAGPRLSRRHARAGQRRPRRLRRAHPAGRQRWQAFLLRRPL